MSLMEYHVRGPNRPAGVPVLLAAGLAVVAAVAVLSLAMRRSDNFDGELLNSLPNEALAGAQIHLRAATPGEAALATISADEAVGTVDQAWNGAPKLKERPRLGVWQDPDVQPEPVLVWVVSTDRALPPSSGGIPVEGQAPWPTPRADSQSYWIDVVDAKTGEWLWAAAGRWDPGRVTR